MSASGSGMLVPAALQALRAVPGLTGTYDGQPIQAALPYVQVEAGMEGDWSHKSGTGRELRLNVMIRDKGERPERLRALIAGAEQAMVGIAPTLPGWQVVTLHFLRSRIAKDGQNGWAGVLDFRARLLRAD